MELQQYLIKAAATGLVHSCCDIGSGGLLVALAKASLQSGIGCEIKSLRLARHPEAMSLFAEGDATIITCKTGDVETLQNLAAQNGVQYCNIGLTTSGSFRFSLGAFDTGNSPTLIDTTVDQLRPTWSETLESQLAEEVLA